jgi:hypothetical protein
MPQELITEDDLDLIYILVDIEGRPDRVPVSARDAADAEFRKWIVEFGAYNNVQILPVMGRIGYETRVAMINRLIRNGVRIAKLATDPPRA